MAGAHGHPRRKLMNITRREFTGLMGVGVASQCWPGLARAEERKVGYCIVGLGRIASHFMPAISGVAPGKDYRSRQWTPGKSRADRRQYGVPKTAIYDYQNYEEIARNRTSKPCTSRCERHARGVHNSRRRAGKHVLCEKPMATSLHDAESHDRRLPKSEQEADDCLSLHYEPTNLRAVQLIREGSLGKIQAIESAFASTSRPASGGSTRS